MNDNGSVLWSHQMPGGGGPNGTESHDDFSSFLDFSAAGNLENNTITAGGNDHMAMEEDMFRFPDMQQQQQQHNKPMQPHLLNQRSGMQSGGMVPPTPTSMELHGGIPHAQYPTSMAMDPYYGPRDDQVRGTRPWNSHF
jgi:hypothetical protein